MTPCHFSAHLLAILMLVPSRAPPGGSPIRFMRACGARTGFDGQYKPDFSGKWPVKQYKSKNVSTTKAPLHTLTLLSSRAPPGGNFVRVMRACGARTGFYGTTQKNAANQSQNTALPLKIFTDTKTPRIPKIFKIKPPPIYRLTTT